VLTQAPDASHLWQQIVWLVLLALPVATVSWTVVHEEIFREAREYCVDRSKNCRTLVQRKFFYVFTCEYCFSHYVAAAAVGLTDFRLLVTGWPGALIAWLTVVWVANVYMSLFVRLRLDIKRERVEISAEEREAGAVRESGGAFRRQR
jgi:hypothetical protein